MKTVLFVSALVVSSMGYAQSPKVGEVNITDASASGSGCRAGSTRMIVTNSKPGSRNADYLQITYDDFIVRSGEGTSTRDQRKSCNIGFNVTFPEGYKFYFKNLSFDGFADLQSGTNAEFQTTIRVPFGNSLKYKSLLRGPFDGDFDDSETGKRLSKFDSGCTGSALIKLENKLRIKGDTDQEGKVGVDVGSGQGHQGLKIFWEKC